MSSHRALQLPPELIALVQREVLRGRVVVSVDNFQRLRFGLIEGPQSEAANFIRVQ